MKAKDLMIGDWVKHPNGQNRITVIQDNDVVFTDYAEDISGACDLDKLEPIPLTHDIIKANGFELTEVGDNGPGTPRQNLNRYEKHECKTKWRDITMWYDRMTKNWCLHGINSIKLNYVHELQHAMRLCGIDKEITL